MKYAVLKPILASTLSLTVLSSTLALPVLAADNPYGYVSGGSASGIASSATVSTPVANSASTYSATPAAPTSYSYPSPTASGSYGTGSYGTGSYDSSAYSSSAPVATPSYGTGSYGTSSYGASPYSSSASPYASSTGAYPSTASPYASSYASSSPYTGSGGSYTTSGYPMADTLRAGITTIPQGTIIMTRLDSPVNSIAARSGDPVSGTVEADIYNGNQLVIPAGSSILGSVLDVTPAGRVGKHGSMALQFNLIRRPDGSTLPFQGHLVTEDNSGILKAGTRQSRIISTAVPAVGGAAAGTVLGAATGGLLGVAGTGAGTGLAIGTIGGVSYALLRKGKQVNLPSGSRLSVMVDQPVAVN